jgi:hypothetical protein
MNADTAKLPALRLLVSILFWAGGTPGVESSELGWRWTVSSRHCSPADQQQLSSRTTAPFSPYCAELTRPC